MMDCGDHANNSMPSDTKHLKEGALQKISKFCRATAEDDYPYANKWQRACASRDFPERRGSLPSCNILHAVKRPKVYDTRDFPEGCAALASGSYEKGTKGFQNVVAAEHSNAAICVADVSTKSTSELLNSLASCSRNHDMGRKTNVGRVKDVVSSSMTWKEEQEKVAITLGRRKQAENRAYVKAFDPGYGSVVGSNEGPKYNLNANEVAKVKNTLKLFRELHKKLSNEYKAERRGEGIGARRFDIEAANILKKEWKWIHSVKQFGHIPGIAIGDQFHFRAELSVVGLHCQYTSGIDYVVRDRKKFATSIVNSGRYENKAKTVDVLIYSGQGGQHGCGNKADQKLERGNLALMNSMERGYPVRVIHKSKAYNNLFPNDKGGFAYIYDGLYVVKKSWRERDQDGRFVFKFELHRMLGQQNLSHRYGGGLRKLKECCVVEDVSKGKENMPIRAMNGIDGEKPPTFTYITNVVYPERCKKIQYKGCNCINGCSKSGKCPCVSKNGGEIPFSEKGSILKQNAIVYACGPSCRCPPSCVNRVSQHGPRYKLELYKTESRGWSVRSQSYISSGSFVCEYVGKLVQIKKAKRKVDHEQGRFMGLLDSKSTNHGDDENENENAFTIDASKFGNVGRFISYSSISPNLFVQRIVFDHDDERMPHIMLFAAKNIRPSQELTCDYNHQMDRVCQFQYRI